MAIRDKYGRFVKGHEVPNGWIKKCKEKDNWQRGKERYNWKEIVNQGGYNFCSIGNGKYIREHHKIWIVHNQCLIPTGYVIHHVNEDKSDNQIENLKCLSRAEHLRLHNPLSYRWG